MRESNKMRGNLLLTVFISLICWVVSDNFKKPSILIGILVRNKAHTLPYFLSYLETLDYPKDRISLWIRSDNNVDNTIEILNTWIDKRRENYHSLNVLFDEESKGFKDEKGIADWTPTRFTHIIKLREEMLEYARKIWADFLFILDADVFLTNSMTLELLVSKNKTVVAPLLKSDGMYSNFWAGMTPDYYYKRTDEYVPILQREEVGCIHVPMVHSAVMIDMRRLGSNRLTYNPEKLQYYDGPKDDIITFAIGANRSGVPLHVCNDEAYGYVMVPLENLDTFENDFQQLVNLKVEMLVEQESIPISKILQRFIKHPEKDMLGLGNVYMINLLRRPERRRRMQHCFNELGIRAEIIDAVDGKTLNETILRTWGIKMMPEYKDPYHNRPMTMGEVGCFLSHYVVWKMIVENDYEQAMVLEDDVKFEPYFRQKVTYAISELKRLKVNWDLVYLGRKRMEERDEPWLEGSNYFVHAGYSYWTVGYILSAQGAKKLLQAKPLENMLPVDEYLPILFDKHPRDNWKGHFSQRTLVALSTSPLLLYPTHYTGEAGYISDTEDSKTIVDPIKTLLGREEL